MKIELELTEDQLLILTRALRFRAETWKSHMDSASETDFEQSAIFYDRYEKTWEVLNLFKKLGEDSE